MSDDLAKRLRLPSFSKRDRLAAADRIEELEGQLQSILDRETSILRYYDAKLDAADAKLTKAVEALGDMEKVPRSEASTGILKVMIRYTLAELKGQDDEL